MPDKTGRGLGIPKEWKIDPRHITKGLLGRTTSLFHWEYLSTALSREARVVPARPPQALTWSGVWAKTQPVALPHPPFSW
jgi:hypothetical protein